VTLPKLVVITDWSLGEARLFQQLEAALGASTTVAVQHRNPGATTRLYFEQGQRLKALCDRRAAELFVSARVDVARALGAHLHLPAWALGVADVRRALPPGRWLSVAVHNEAEAAGAQGADLALVSPVFETRSKPGASPLGSAGFTRLARALDCPAYALGGLTPDGLAGLPDAAGAAVITAVLHAGDPAAAVRAFRFG
jgi:thiamine-phosphate pyrophosphorylase